MNGLSRTLRAAALAAGLSTLMHGVALATPEPDAEAKVASTDLRGSIPAEEKPAPAAEERPVVLAPLPEWDEMDGVEEMPQSAVIARIDLSEQKMVVYVKGALRYEWKISSGAIGFDTPTGYYAPEWLSAYHRSKKYHNAPMPWSVFFYEGYAVHGTTDLRNLGSPASHGCIRLHPENAKAFFDLVQKFGMNKTSISVVR